MVFSILKNANHPIVAKTHINMAMKLHFEINLNIYFELLTTQ
jgi:hypothetical protein